MEQILPRNNVQKACAPARMMQVTTGVSSRDSASARTPPTDLVSPSFVNSRTNCSPRTSHKPTIFNGSWNLPCK